MLDIDMQVCPVFVRWQIYCPKCRITFYVDSEPESAEEDIMKLDEMNCGYHPKEDSVVMVA